MANLNVIHKIKWYAHQPMGTPDARKFHPNWNKTFIDHIFNADVLLVQHVVKQSEEELVGLSDLEPRKITIPVNYISLILEFLDALDDRFIIQISKIESDTVHISYNQDCVQIIIVNTPKPIQ